MLLHDNCPIAFIHELHIIGHRLQSVEAVADGVVSPPRELSGNLVPLVPKLSYGPDDDGVLSTGPADSLWTVLSPRRLPCRRAVLVALEK